MRVVEMKKSMKKSEFMMMEGQSLGFKRYYGTSC